VGKTKVLYIYKIVSVLSEGLVILPEGTLPNSESPEEAQDYKIRSGFKTYRWYNWQELLLWIKKYTLTSFVAFWMRLEGKTPKMENQQFVSPSRQCSSTPVAFCQGCLSKEQFDNTGASPILSWAGCSWFLPVPSTEISTEGTALLTCNWH